MSVTDFTPVEQAHEDHRRLFLHRGPVRHADVHPHGPGINQRVAVAITRSFGTMWAFYALVVWMFAWMACASLGIWLFANDHYPFAFLLFLSNLVQLFALPILSVGQNVLAAAGDARQQQTFDITKAIHLINVQQLQILQQQTEILRRLEQDKRPG